MRLPPPRRVLVIGPPGVGKSATATPVAAMWGLPHVELDSLKLRPVRVVRSTEDFRADLESIVANDQWVLDGNWEDDDFAAGVWEQADLVLWLDYPRFVVMRQVLARSARRWWRREDYYGWNERLRDWLSPTHPLRWSWTMVAGYRHRYLQMTSRHDAKVVRLSSRRDAASFMAEQDQPQTGRS